MGWVCRTLPDSEVNQLRQEHWPVINALSYICHDGVAGKTLCEVILPRVLLNKEGDSVLYLKSVRVKLIRGLYTAPLRPMTSGPRGNNSLRRHHPVFHQGMCGNPHEELIPSRTRYRFSGMLADLSFPIRLVLMWASVLLSADRRA